MSQSQVLKAGDLFFTIESRVLRELGERLVREPEIAINELVKNAYDADAERCEVHMGDDEIVVKDTGSGMTLGAFTTGWMRIGTSSKAAHPESKRYGRYITGEKGIGRFAVRFLGEELSIESVADDSTRKCRTKLTASFDWPTFDKHEDLGKVKVPYELTRVGPESQTGTTLTISGLRPAAATLDYRAIRTGSLAILTPFRSLMTTSSLGVDGQEQDPGFQLVLADSADEAEEKRDDDVAGQILDRYILRGTLQVRGSRLSLRIYARDEQKAYFQIQETIKNDVGSLNVDLRFFPQRAGTFQGLPLDGRAAKTWLKRNSGVAVFDRSFRVYPYGTPGDDWLKLSSDSVRNERSPRSSLAKKHFQMDDATRRSTELNYMLRLPHSEQLVGIVEVAGVRSSDANVRSGLTAAADREGFIRNAAFLQLEDLVRGVAEAIAYVDRERQQEANRLRAEESIATLREDTQNAIRAIESDRSISASVKRDLVASFVRTQESAEQAVELSKERESTLEVMSLMGVVAGFMTHEFGAALHDLERARDQLEALGRKEPSFKEEARKLTGRLGSLHEFVAYSQGYVQGASQKPTKPYPVYPRVQQVVRVFGKYADERGIAVQVEIAKDLIAPLVPPSLYNGLALNLYTNALKAVTAAARPERKEIVFRAWNEKSQHILEVSDTGVGIPEVLRSRVFDPLFTTTSANRDPLGSGLGLGLALVRRCAQAFGGNADVIDPPPGFSTCFRVKLPLT